MARDMTQLLDEIVFIESIDAQEIAMNAAKYQAAARKVRAIVQRDLGRLSMKDFVTKTLPALQVTAENIYFEGHGHFADLEGNGLPAAARAGAEGLLLRLRSGVMTGAWPEALPGLAPGGFTPGESAAP